MLNSALKFSSPERDEHRASCKQVKLTARLSLFYLILYDDIQAVQRHYSARLARCTNFNFCCHLLSYAPAVHTKSQTRSGRILNKESAHAGRLKFSRANSKVASCYESHFRMWESPKGRSQKANEFL